VDELGHRDFVTSQIGKTRNVNGGAWLVLNGPAAKEIQWHVVHYSGRGIMKRDLDLEGLSKAINVPVAKLTDTIKKYNEVALAKKDPFGKQYFHNIPWDLNDKHFAIALITPVVHYCMGGLGVTHDAAVFDVKGKTISGLWAAGEVMGGVHGANRLGGNSLLDCVVFGLVAGASASSYILKKLSSGQGAGKAVGGSGVSVTVSSGGVDVNINFNGSQQSVSSSSSSSSSSSAVAPSSSSAPAAPAKKVYTAEEVAKHNKETDCWVIVNGEVLDVTNFLADHPGGKKPIMLFAGRDASTEFNLLHKPDVIEKYAPEVVIGTLATKAKL
jgi:cytochrome b involved in lipid metabolism